MEELKPSTPANGRRHRTGLRSQAEHVVKFSRHIDALIVGASFAYVWHPVLWRSALLATMAMLVVPVWMELLRYFGLYESHRLHGFPQFVRQLASAELLGGLILLFPAALAAGADGVERVLLFLALNTLALLLQKASLRAGLIVLRRSGVDHRNVCVIGGWEAAGETAREFQKHPEWGLHVAIVGTGDAENREYFTFQDRALAGADLEDAFRKHVIDEVWIGVPFEQLSDERPVMALCNQYGLLGRLLVVSSVPEIHDADVADFHGTLSIGVGGLRHRETAMAAKRVVDLLLGAFLLIGALPVILVTAILVKLSSPGPVFFSQTRVGLRGRQFRLFKFRTMVDGAETITDAMQAKTITRGPIYKDPRDWRITPIGGVLRKFSIDEIPQLWNVLRGEMSLVGPRPLPVPEADAISGSHRKRFSMRPGLTCLWQVNGRSNLDYTQWMRYDSEYVDDWSLWLDFRLIFKTVSVVLSGRGAY